MAGDWIKMRNDLADDPAVISIACILEIDEFSVVGRLHHLWSWADRQSRDGHASGVTKKWLDGYLKCDGFATALVNVGWLVVDESGLTIPNFDTHNGKSAKTRALAGDRKKKSRENVTDLSRNESDKGVTREEKRREEIKDNDKSLSSGKGGNDYPDWFIKLWEHYPTRAGSNNKKLAFQKANARIKGGKTFGELLAAVERYRFFVVATGKVSTEYVKQASTFFGSVDHIDNPWTVPNSQASRPYGGAQTKFDPIAHLNGMGSKNSDSGGLNGIDGKMIIEGEVVAHEPTNLDR